MRIGLIGAGRIGAFRAEAPDLVAMLEPFMCHRADGRVVNDLSAPAVIRSVAARALVHDLAVRP